MATKNIRKSQLIPDKPLMHATPLFMGLKKGVTKVEKKQIKYPLMMNEAENKVGV